MLRAFLLAAAVLCCAPQTATSQLSTSTPTAAPTAMPSQPAPSAVPTTAPTGCGILTPVSASECGAVADALGGNLTESAPNCLDALPCSFCDGDGECGTNPFLNNCPDQFDIFQDSFDIYRKDDGTCTWAPTVAPTTLPPTSMPTPSTTATSTATSTPTTTATSTPTTTATSTITSTATTSETSTATTSETSTATTSQTSTATTTRTSSQTSTATSTETSSPTTSATTSATSSATSSATTSQTTSATTSQTSSATTSQTTSGTTSVTTTPTTTATSTPTSTTTTTPTSTGTSTETSTPTTTETSTPTTTATATPTTSQTTTGTTSATTSATSTRTSSATTSGTTSGTSSQTTSATTSQTTSGTTTATTTATTSATSSQTTSPTSTTATSTPTTTENFETECAVVTGQCYLDRDCRTCAVNAGNESTTFACVRTNDRFREVIRNCRMNCRPLYLLQADATTVAFECWMDMLQAPTIAQGRIELSSACQADEDLRAALVECADSDFDDASWTELFTLVINVTNVAPTEATAAATSDNALGTVDILIFALVGCILLCCCCWFALFSRSRRKRGQTLPPPVTHNPLWPPEPPKPPIDWRFKLETKIRATNTLSGLYPISKDIKGAIAGRRITPADVNILDAMFSARAAALFTHTLNRISVTSQLRDVGDTIEQWASEALFTEPDARELKSLFVSRWSQLEESTPTQPDQPPRAVPPPSSPLSFKVSPDMFASSAYPSSDSPNQTIPDDAEVEAGQDTSTSSDIRANSVSPRSATGSTRRKGSTRRPVGSREGSPGRLTPPPKAIAEQQERRNSVKMLKRRGVDRYVTGLENKTEAELKDLVAQTERSES